MATQLMTYSLQASVCLLLFYLFYRLLLRSQPSLKFNRFYILVAPLVALGLPFIELPMPFVPVTILSPALQAIQLPEVIIVAATPEAQTTAEATLYSALPQFLLGIYALVALALLGRLGLQLFRILQLVSSASPLPGSTAKAILLQGEESQPTFAFLRYILLNHPPHLTKKERGQVLDHEMAHVHLYHSLDVLYYELVVILLWFHPAVWLLRAELQDVHEFQADALAIQKHQPQQYSSLLVKYTLHANGITIGSNFNRNQIFKRLHMLQEVGKPISLLRYVLVVPLLCLLGFFFSAQQVSADIQSVLSIAPPATKEIARTEGPSEQLRQDNAPENESGVEISKNVVTESTEKVALPVPPAPQEAVATQRPDKPAQTKQPAANELAKKNDPVNLKEELPYTFAEQMPAFAGGQQEMFRFIAENVRYPEEAVKNKIQGTVYVSFVVWQDGSIGDIAVLRGIGAGADEEAVRVVASMSGNGNLAARMDVWFLSGITFLSSSLSDKL